MALAQRQPTKDEIETPAGVIKLEVPLREIITKPSGERAYTITLKPHGSSEEILTGHIGIEFKKVGYLPGILYTAARITKLTNEDTVAEITAFYPFREEPRLVGKDMGIAVMNLLLRHCESEGIAAVYTRTTNPAMLQLLGKAGFQNIEGYYLKKI
jgi:hypothetical protein